MTLGYITVIGSLNIDHIFFIDRLPILGESYEAQKYKKALGGKGANAAIATYRSCHKNLQAEPDEQPELDILVRMIGAVGDDADGTGMLEILGKADVDVSGVVQVKDGTTGMTFIMVEEPKSEDGSEQETTTVDNRIIYTIGANATLQPAQFANADNLTDRDGIRPDLIISQLEIAREAVETILKTAHKAGIQVLLNAAPAKELRSEFYCYVTHLLVNEAEAAMLYGCPPKEVNHDSWAEIAKYFLESGVENFVITLGAKGAFYAKLQPKSSSSTKPRKITSRLIEAFPVDEVVDPTGAGDTFTGAYAAEYVRQRKESEPWNIEKAVRRANAAGALAVTKAGAQEGIPWADKIDELVNNKYESEAEYPEESLQETIIPPIVS